MKPINMTLPKSSVPMPTAIASVPQNRVIRPDRIAFRPRKTVEKARPREPASPSPVRIWVGNWS